MTMAATPEDQPTVLIFSGLANRLRRSFADVRSCSCPMRLLERVRSIFCRYLEVSAINELVRDLRTKNIRTKAKTFSSGKTRGGIPFGRGALSYFLRNRFFIGEVKYGNEILPGEQPAILDRALFEAVQH